MNEFQKAEQKGREQFLTLLQQIEATDIVFTEDEFDRTDCYFTFKGRRLTAEIKVRNIAHNQYPTHLLEVSKLEALVEIQKEQQLDNFWYVNFFNDGVCCIYDRQRIKQGGKIQYYHCNRTTVVDNGKINKKMIELDRKVALTLQYNGEKWENKK